jgi:hypothetical protein
MICVRRDARLSRGLLVLPTVVFVVFASAARAQEKKQFSSGGTSFSYPAEWSLEDKSSNDVLQLSLLNKGDDALVQVVVIKKKVESKTGMADLKKQVIEPWVGQLVKQYESGGVSITREPATDNIGESEAEGVRFKFAVDNQMGVGEAFWALVGKHLVLLYFVRPEKTAESATSGWDMLRKSLRTDGDKK